MLYIKDGTHVALNNKHKHIMNILKSLGLKIKSAIGVSEVIKNLINFNLSKKAWTHVIFMRWNKEFKQWCFDIPILGIEDEPFVSGIPEIIDYHLSRGNKLKGAKENGTSVLFSGDKNKPKNFSVGHYFKLVKLQEENGGCWYRDPTSKMEGWLCPNLFQFFATAPKQIHICIRG